MAYVASAPLIFALAGAGWGRPSITIGAALASVLLASVVWYWRERRLARLRTTIGQIHGLSETILACQGAAGLHRQIETELGLILDTSAVTIYVREPDEGLTALDGSAAPPPAAATDSPPLALRCLAESAAVRGVIAGPPPQPALCLPMLAQNELAGVIQFTFGKGVPALPREAVEALQHLANQTAIALKLLDQQLLREQMLRGEKLGAAGQLISGVAQELSVPLDSIVRSAALLLERASGSLRPDLEALAGEAGRASETLSRLVSFARGEQTKARPVDLDALLAGLAEFRARQWSLRSISGDFSASGEEAFAVGAQGQLEQALLSLLLHAEEQLEKVSERRLHLAVRTRAGRALVEIVYSAPFHPAAASPQGEGAWGLDVCRGIVANHGGSFHHGEAPGGARFEVDLPLTRTGARPSATRPAAQACTPLTILLAGGAAAPDRRLLAGLAARRHRVAPAANAAEALDRLERFRFDLLIASSALPGMTWVELAERARRHVPRVLILTEPLESGVSAAHPAVTLLSRSAPEEELERYLAATSPAAPAS